MGTIILWIIGIALCITFWPLLVLAGVIWLIYLYPIPGTITAVVLLVVGYLVEISSKNDLSTIAKFLEGKGMADIDQILEGTSISKESVNTALDTLVEKNKVEKVELSKGEFLYKSHNYKEVSKTMEIELD